MTDTRTEAGLAYATGAEADAVLTESVTQVIRRQAAAHGDRAAVRWRDGAEVKSLTYRELAEAVNAVAHSLSGLEPGSRVGVWSRNSIEFVLLELAIGTRGLMMCALNTAWTDAEAAYAVDMVGPSVVFTGYDGLGRPLEDRARQLAADIPVVDIASLSGLAPAPESFLDVDPQTPYIVQFTSGTTGFPKGAMISQHAAVNGGWLRLQHSAGTEDVSLNAVPLHHVGGAVSIVFGALTTGSAFVVLSKFDVDEFIWLLGEVGGTHFGGVPIMVERLLNHPDVRSKGRDVKVVGLGGADISPFLIRRVNDELGADVITTYGQSECPFIANSVEGDDPDLIATTAGRPGDATTLRIVDPGTGEVLKFGETGEIQISSPMVMLGYYGDPERTAEVLPGDGFLRSGDLGSIDEHGYLRIHGRIREVIIRGGENIYPAEVEAALSTHPDVTGSAVVGLSDPSWGETVAASVISTNPELTGADLEEYLEQRLAHFKIPRTWRFVAELPMTASGKIRRVEVKAGMNHRAPSAG
ncbi:class I adenylate-forming enzyme family protein [Nakamurella lactea]|uniref:class I adenylate-forming enzyme family protein n=1 Tax=Nakamurella lactea TaxID=459515 RepID=UPI001376D653|nr:class I adenylate-forming enzyme family protein [Nakamurella lactea]